MTTNAELMAHAAARAAGWPDFVAAPLARYQVAHQLTDADLATLLGIDTAALSRLRLCKAPSGAMWGQGITRIAQYVGANPEALAMMLPPEAE